MAVVEPLGESMGARRSWAYSINLASEAQLVAPIRFVEWTAENRQHSLVSG
jgi:hypothetical protein